MIKDNKWKKSLRKNKVKTFFTISFFILTYCAIGLMLDISRYAGMYLGENGKENIKAVSYAVLTLKLFPYIALLMSIVACISILITLCMHNRIMLAGKNYSEVNENTKDSQDLNLLKAVKKIAFFADLKYTPKLFIIEEKYTNAFASGYSEKSAMIALTRGIINELTEKELQAVIAHEISHIKHLDIRLTLMASVLTNITSVALDYLFFSSLNDREYRESNKTFYSVIYVMRLLLPTITMFMMLALSRSREYMADSRSVEIMGNNKPLASALIKIHNSYSNDPFVSDSSYEYTRSASYIFNPKVFIPEKTFMDFFSTHPTLKERLEAIGVGIENKQKKTDFHQNNQ